jgi:hypothetical protein
MLVIWDIKIVNDSLPRVENGINLIFLTTGGGMAWWTVDV